MAIGTAGFTFPFTKGLGYQQFAAQSGLIKLGGVSPTSPTTGTAGIPAGATYCVVAVETNAMRWRDDGDPSASIGMPVAAGSTLSFQENFNLLEFIAQTGSITLNVWYGA